MTRNNPQPPPQGYQNSGAYEQTAPYAEEDYSSPSQDYPSYPPQPTHFPESEGYAQPMNASNETSYQQYQSPPNQQYPSVDNQSYPSNFRYGQQYDPPSYGQNPSYGQEYPSPPLNYIQQPSSDVDAFRSHFDVPEAGSSQYPDAQQDRGFLGAFTGGAAGLVGGHKMGHSVLGAIGGGIAGSKLEDAYKKHEKEKKAEQYASNHVPATSMGGNFHASSRDVRLEGHCTLVADCAHPNGHHHQSRLDLNDCFTNTNGRLHWARGGNFAASSRDIRLVEHGNVLEADLGDGQGGWIHNSINLNERITNDGGHLEML